MKKLLATLCICLSVSAYSQKRETPVVIKYAEFAYATPERDTLFLASGGPMSEITLSSWKSDPEWKGINPVVLFIPKSDLDIKKEIFYKKINKVD